MTKDNSKGVLKKLYNIISLDIMIGFIHLDRQLP